MAYSAMTKLALVVAFCMVVSVPIAQAITCGQVSSSLAPCIAYMSGGGAVPPACCNGIRNVNNLAKNTPDRQAACNCLKQLSASIPGVNLNIAAALPGKCGVSIPYKISASTNCKTVK